MSFNTVMKYEPGIFKYKALAWSCFIFFMLLTIFAWLKGEVFASLVFLSFAALGVLILSIASSIKISQEAIYVYSIFAKYRMYWHEIELVEIGDWVLVFHGKGNKRLVVPTQWSGKQTEDALKILNDQVISLNIKETHSGIADYKIHKNVRVKND